MVITAKKQLHSELVQFEIPVRFEGISDDSA